MHRLEFTESYSYANEENGVAVEATVRCGANKIRIVSSVDGGAAFCLFAGEIAERLGLDLTAGEPKRFRTANSFLDAFGHEIEISAMGVATYTMAYFFADPSIDRNVLGRTGWLDRVRLGLVHHDSRIYLAPYDGE